MKNINNNKWHWIWVVMVIILPLILVRLFNEELIRITAVGLIATLLPLLIILFSLFSPIESFFANPKKYEHNKKSLRNLVIGIKVIASGISILALIFFTLPVGVGIYKYTHRTETVPLVTNKVHDLDSGLIDPFRVINIRVQVGQLADDSYSYWYPTLKLEIGKSYEFKILPDTDIVISVKEN